MPKRIAIAVTVFAVIVSSCGDDDGADTTTTTAAPATTTSAAPPTTTDAPTTTEAPTTTAATPAMGPAQVVFEAQSSDGSSIVVASVTLPAPGFIAVHGNADGSPGAVIGHSALLPEGTSTDVAITLDEPLASTDLVFPMAHIDVNQNGEYDFLPPENTADAPAQTADGGIAVVGAEVTVEDTAAADSAMITIEGFSFGRSITVSVGETVTIRNEDAAPHTWTSTEGAFNSGTLGQGEEFTFTFDEAGEYPFMCTIHPSMTGTITVTDQ